MKSDVLFETIFGELLQKTMTLEKAIALLADQDLINIGELAEVAISKRSGVSLCEKNTPEVDLVSGVQIKHAQTNPYANSGRLLAHVSIKGTSAPILAVVTERKRNKQYFFSIPYSARAHLYGNTIAIPFDAAGNPTDNQWWQYEVNSFDELCELAK
jgi:hypothetical protein